MAGTFKVKNWEKFQHYKNRNPPWIRFYNSILDDYAFTSLPDASRSHLLAIWLLASRTNNCIPYDAEWVRMAIKATSPVSLEELVEAGFIIPDQDCSVLLADCKQRARPETEKSRDRVETEAEVRADARDADGYAFAGSVVRLKRKDFENWERAYSHLDLRAELTARDVWLASDQATAEDRKKWFISTSKYLANRNAEAKAKQKSNLDDIYPPEIYRGLQ